MLAQLHQATTQRLAAHSFRPGTIRNHLHQASTFITFYDHYSLPFIMPSAATLCYYVTYLSQHFKSPHSLSGVRFLHKELGMTLATVGSFPVTSLLRAMDILMHDPPPPPPLGASPSYPGCCTSLGS